MPEYKTLMQNAEKMPQNLIQQSKSGMATAFGFSFGNRHSSVDVTELSYAQLIEKTARVLPYYPVPAEKVKVLILSAICLYVWKSYESCKWSIFSSPLVVCLKEALEIDSLSKYSPMQIKGYFAALEKFSHWVFLNRHEAQEIESLYSAFPDDMQAKFQESKLILSL